MNVTEIDKKLAESAKADIASGNASLVVIKDGKISGSFEGGGVAPAIAAYESGLLDGAYVVDKVIGKASAMILSLGNISGCFGMTISKPALEYLASAGVSADYDTLVEYIINRAGDGMCPMEATVVNITDPAAALAAVKEKLAAMTKK